MKPRFLFFLLFLAVACGLVGYGLFGNRIRVYPKPDARDDPANPPMDSSFLVSEIQLTEWRSVERVQPDGFGHLIDLEQEAECFS